MKLGLNNKIILIIITLLGLSSCSTPKDYETGYVTKGNPDNSYLDTTKAYGCGD